MLIGNITRDPELRTTPSGQPVASFSLATNRVWKDPQSSERKETAEFHNIVAWRKLAEICGQYLRKGSKIFIEGRIQTRSWQDQQGNKRYTTEIIAENMIMLDRKSTPDSYTEKGYAESPADGKAETAKNSISDEEIPTIDIDENQDEIKIEDIPF